MANYIIHVTTSWSGNAAGKPSDLTNSGAFAYVIATGSTQSDAVYNLSGTSSQTGAYVCAGSSDLTFSLSCDSSPCYAEIMAIRPGCLWSGPTMHSVGLLQDRSVVNVNCECQNTMDGNLLLRREYLIDLTETNALSSFGRPYYMRQLFMSPRIQYEPFTMNQINGDLCHMSESPSGVIPYPYDANKCISLSTFYFNQSTYKSGSITVGSYGSYGVWFDIEIPAGMGNLGNIDVYISENQNSPSTAADTASFTYYGSSIYDSSDLDIDTSSVIVFLGVSLSANPNNRVIILEYGTISQRFYGGTNHEIAVMTSEIDGNTRFTVKME